MLGTRNVRLQLSDELYRIGHYIVKREELEVFVRGRGIAEWLGRPEISVFEIGQ